MIHPVLLCGGAGTRLWPLSRRALPKQFLPLISDKSLLQSTLLRLRGLSQLSAPIVVCSNDHRFLVADQLQEVGITPASLILEPMARNTAPAVALAALSALQRDSKAQLLILPADHVIGNVPAFHAAINAARPLADEGYMTAFGVVPTKPETGYGYIHQGAKLGEGESEGGFEIAQFVEKPDEARARQFVEAGDYLWNSGMYLFDAQLYLTELHLYQPEVHEAARLAFERAQVDLDFLRADEEAFAQSPSISLDYGVMEQTKRAAVVPADIDWNDIGSYTAMWEIEPKDADGNVGKGEVAFFDSTGNYVRTEKQLVALLGVENMIVVSTPDALLVTRKEHAQDIKKIVDKLREEGLSQHDTHTKVYRPWGSYEGVERGERFQVKQLIVKPGGASSMQIHHHRSEHWIVVKGTAEVTLGDEKRLLSEDESIYIPLGIPHRIYNPGRIPMHFIEVQSGSYLEEDDIVRLDDNYGRG